MSEKNVFVVGIQGVPARYGGFETLVDQLVSGGTTKTVSYTIFCEKERDKSESPSTYRDASLIYLPFKANGAQSVLYDVTGMFISLRQADVILVLGTSGAIAIPLVKLLRPKIRIITNIGGLEWQRSKWGMFAKWFLKQSESIAVRYSDAVVADNQKLINYVDRTYGVQAHYIPYGGDHCPGPGQCGDLEFEGLTSGSYYFGVARCQPDNNLEMIMDAFSGTGKQLIFVSNWDSSDYGDFIREKYKSDENIWLIGPIYEIKKLSEIRGHAAGYIHGHSAGGTNPALVEAMWQGAHIFAFDNGFNQCTAGNAAQYFGSSDELRNMIREHKIPEASNALARSIAKEKYTWSRVSDAYVSLYSAQRTPEITAN